MRHVFIINPQAGKGHTLSHISRIEEICKAKGIDPIIEITKAPGHATEIAKQYSAEEGIRIYSVGGDGTLNEVVNGIAGSKCSLAVIPSGSGNDFIRSISKSASWEEVLKKSMEAEAVPVDIGRFDNNFFINISSAGLDAEIVYNSRRFKKNPFIPSRFAYLLSIFVTVFGYKSRDMKIMLDDSEIHMKTLLVAIANGKFYGGGMMVAPIADISDGTFDICHIEKVGALKVIRLFPWLIKGKHEGIKQVRFYKSKKVKVKCDGEMSFNVDGELYRRSEVEFEVVPNALNIVIPQI